jgi:hypothetical protein
LKDILSKGGIAQVSQQVIEQRLIVTVNEFLKGLDIAMLAIAKQQRLIRDGSEPLTAERR